MAGFPKNRAVWTRSLIISLSILAVFSSWSKDLERSFIAEAQDKTPPSISKIEILDVAATTTLVRWVTDEESNSVVNYGPTRFLGVSTEPNPSVKSHEVLISGLDPATIYYFRVGSSDRYANQSFSGTFQFTTKGTKKIENIETIQDPEQKVLTQRIVESISKVTEQAAFNVIADQLQAAGEESLRPPKIIGEPRIEIGAEQATVFWETDKEANSQVEFGSESEYQSGGYSRKEGDSEEYSTRHQVTLHGLRPLTLYHYKITSRAKVGPIGESEDRTFTTKSILPQIFDLRLRKVEEDSATISWSTQVPAGGLVEYTNLNTREVKSIGDPSLQVTHTIRLPDLKFRSPYSVVVKSRTPSGDEVSAQPLNFVTTKDDSPPIIINVNNESTLYPGADAKVQTIVSWDTDEQSSCQFYYGEGIAVTDESAESLPEETGLSLKHVQVVTTFLPSTAYKFWVRCNDRNENNARSEDFVLFTPEKEKNIIDIIIENFEGTFGWVKNIGK